MAEAQEVTMQAPVANRWRDLFAVLIIAFGVLLAFWGHKDEAMMTIGGGLGAFKGEH